MKISVNDIQVILLKMIKEVVGICERNNIDYYLVKGGLIGAVKYKGFIPWDPDVDFVIKVEDLNRFCQCVANEISEPFELYFYTEEKDYEYLFPRVGVRNLDYRQLHLDIFLLSFFPENGKAQEKAFKTLYRIEALNTLRNSKINRPINSLINRLLLLLARVLLFWIPREYVRNKHLEVLRSFKNEKKYVIHAGAVEEYGKKYIMPAEWFGNPVLLSFEDIQLRCPRDYDSYLRQMYGNYVNDPPMQEQIRQRKRVWTFNDEILKGLLEADE